MRTLVTVAQLRDIKLHAFRDRTGAKHVTGITVHGALAVPTRTFWESLAALVSSEELSFGNEYALYKSAVLSIGDTQLYFSISVDEQGNALLDEVTDAYEDTDSNDSIVRALVNSRRLGDLSGFEEVAEDDDAEAFAEAWADDWAKADDDQPEHDFPLLAGYQPKRKDLWGWDGFHQLPKNGTLMNGSEGSVRPSFN